MDELTITNRDMVEYMQTFITEAKKLFRVYFTRNPDEDRHYTDEDESNFGTHLQGRVTIADIDYSNAPKIVIDYTHLPTKEGDEWSDYVVFFIVFHCSYGDLRIELENNWVVTPEIFKEFMSDADNVVLRQSHCPDDIREDIVRLQKIIETM